MATGLIGAAVIFFCATCSQEQRGDNTVAGESGEPTKPVAKHYPREPLPPGIYWTTNETDPVFASFEAKRGGILRKAITSFPPTFRFVGPDSNSSFRSEILDNQFSLIGMHPNTLNIIPELATHWAFGDDKKTMYFRLNPDARWSDGLPVTADDFAYTLDFMRSPFIVAPFYNDYYTKEIDRVIIFDDYTLAVVSTKAQPDLHLRVNIAPTPRHYFGILADDFIQKYNWAIVPNTGAYQIERFRKGRFVSFKRKTNWWADNLKYFKHRYNVDKVLYKVIRDTDLEWEYFKKALLDNYFATRPNRWHIKAKTQVVEKGYVHKMWFFNDTPQSASGLWINQDQEIFKDRNLRYAFAHAINVEKVITDLLRSDYFRLEQAFMGYGAYSNPAIKARRYDIQKVETYMRASGWGRGSDGIWQKEGRRFSVELLYSVDDLTPRMVLLKEEAKKTGIELKLTNIDPASQFKRILEKKHQVAYMAWSTTMRPAYWQGWHSDNAHKPQTNNITNTDDKTLDHLIDQYRDSLVEQERIALSKQIQEKIHETGAFVPTFMVPYFRELYWRWWRFPNPAGTRISDTSLFDSFSSTAGGLFWYDSVLHEQTRQAMKNDQAFEPVVIIDKTFKPS